MGNLLTLNTSRTGTEQLRSLALDPCLFASSIAKEIAMGLDAPGAVMRGDLFAEHMLGEAFGTAGTAMDGGGLAPRPYESVGSNTPRTKPLHQLKANLSKKRTTTIRTVMMMHLTVIKWILVCMLAQVIKRISALNI